MPTSRTLALLLLANPLVATAQPAPSERIQGSNHYTDTVLVANTPELEPLVMVDPLLGNAWGLAIRPPGAGGHFWISNFNSGTTTTYVGDAHKPDGTFMPLFQDDLMQVRIPIGAGKREDGPPIVPISQPTGQVFNHSSSDFVVSGEGITAASKFIFVTAEGTISGWTEIKDPATGVLRRQTSSVITIDQSALYHDDRLRFTGCAVTDLPRDNRLYVTNFIENRVEVYDAAWSRVELPAGRFMYPDQPGNFHIWNIQYFRTGPEGEGRLWGVYAMMEEPWEEDPDFGAIAEFDLEGNFIRRFTTSMDTDPYADSELKAPWGIAIAPDDFGPLSNCMIVANFGNGTLPAFDLATGDFVDWVRDNSGEIMSVDGVWGILFGNGVALGDTNALYYAAGPRSEFDGTFGSVRHTPSTCPTIERQPESVTLSAGQRSAELSIHAPGPVRSTHQWQTELNPGQWSDLSDGLLDGGTSIHGSQTPRLRLSAIDRHSSVRYRCVVTNACGSIISEPAAVTISEAR